MSYDFQKPSAGFLSEMVATPNSGGGVTLARVLGHDLARFDWFAETIRYPHEEPAKYRESRSHSYSFWAIQEKLRPLLGCRLSYWLASRPLTRKRFAIAAANLLIQDEPTLLRSRFLVCPQADITLLIIEELQKRAPVEYITWIMDDHLLRWRDSCWRYPSDFEDVMRRHLTKAEQVFVISPAMRDFYKERFGVNSTVLCAPAEPLLIPALSERRVGTKLRLVYFGSLGRWQNDALELLAPLLAAGEVTLDVYSHNPVSLSNQLLQSGAQVHGGILSSEVLKRSADYDAIVLPISFLDELRNMSDFNIATKFSECLAAPVPTLLIGPPNATMVRVARAASACAVVSDRRIEALEDAIAALRHPGSRKAILDSERKLVAEEFSPEIMRQRWLKASEFLFEPVPSKR